MKNHSHEFQIDTLPSIKFCESGIDKQDLIRPILNHGGIHIKDCLATDLVESLRNEMFFTLERISWAKFIDGKFLPLETHLEPGIRYGNEFLDPQWATGYSAIQSLENFHMLGNHDRLTGVAATILGVPAFSHPRKIARIGFPHHMLATPTHRDRSFNPVPADVLTAWVPLHNCSLESGALLIKNENIATRLNESVQPFEYNHTMDNPMSIGGSWLSAELRLGDVIFFHSCTRHATLPNVSDEIRLSADFRLQASVDPIYWAAILPHGFTRGFAPSWTKISDKWTNQTLTNVPLTQVSLSNKHAGRASRLSLPT